MHNPFSYRDVSLGSCIELLAKIIAGGGWNDIDCATGLGVYVTAPKVCASSSSKEEQEAIQKENRARPILYVYMLHAITVVSFYSSSCISIYR